MGGIFTQQFLSTKPSGGFVPITADASPGTLIHTTPATDIDNVWLWLCPITSDDTICVVQINGVDSIRVKILKDAGPVAVLSGEPLSGSTEIRVFASNANQVAAFGSVQRIATSGTVSTRKFSRIFLGGSTSGRSIVITSTTSPGNTMHTAHATATDLVWLRLAPVGNSDATSYVYDGTTAIRIRLLKELGSVPVLQGVPFSGSAVVSAYSDDASLSAVTGGVDRVA